MPLALGAFIGAARNGRIAAAARADYAAAAVSVLTTDGQEGKTYELAGDHAFTMKELEGGRVGLGRQVASVQRSSCLRVPTEGRCSGDIRRDFCRDGCRGRAR